MKIGVNMNQPTSFPILRILWYRVSGGGGVAGSTALGSLGCSDIVVLDVKYSKALVGMGTIDVSFFLFAIVHSGTESSI
jgi:hypothetical protein